MAEYDDIGKMTIRNLFTRYVFNENHQLGWEAPYNNDILGFYLKGSL